MSEELRQHVDTSSAEFAEGVEAGLNSPEDTNNWQAGNELGQELKHEPEESRRASESLPDRPPNPLFMRNRFEGSDQDEKDKTAE